MIRELWEDELRGEGHERIPFLGQLSGFGESKFKLYESNEGEQCQSNAPPHLGL